MQALDSPSRVKAFPKVLETNVLQKGYENYEKRDKKL